MIHQKIDILPENQQIQVLNFVDFLINKNIKQENELFNQFSLSQAMEGLENDNLPEYTEQDLKEKWQ
ncbi:MAG TPA: DUF2281 domain-containing protein [Allocoleopsis sp.]